jgi:hypothetical protein
LLLLLLPLLPHLQRCRLPLQQDLPLLLHLSPVGLPLLHSCMQQLSKAAEFAAVGRVGVMPHVAFQGCQSTLQSNKQQGGEQVECRLLSSLLSAAWG